MIPTTSQSLITAAAVFVGAGLAAAADGFADVNGVTTGGAGGPVTIVTNVAGFIEAVTRTGPHIILVKGTIPFRSASVKSHKTIAGCGVTPTLIGELQLSGVSNVVVRNLHITNPGPEAGGTGDGIRIHNGAHHVWIDHCTIYDCADGLCDVTTRSDYVTVSWCKFYYQNQSSHRFAMLVAASDTDAGDYRITLHHNWWAQGCDQRMPASRYGTIHLYNNYFNATNNSYCSNARTNAQFLSEHNFYAGVDDPLYRVSNGRIRTSGNIYRGCSGLIDAGTDDVFQPPYDYSLDTVVDVPGLVRHGAGARDVTTAPVSVTVWPVGNALRLTWPSDHIGWRLESRSDGLAGGTAGSWTSVPGSASTNQLLAPTNPVDRNVFFRLAYP